MSMKYIRTYKVIYSDTVIPLNNTLNTRNSRGQICFIMGNNGINIQPSYATGSFPYGESERIAKSRTKIQLIKYTPTGQQKIKYETISESFTTTTKKRIIEDLIQMRAFGAGRFGVVTQESNETEKFWRSMQGATLRLNNVEFLNDDDTFSNYICDELHITPNDMPKGEGIVIKCKVEDKRLGDGGQPKYNTLAFTVEWDSKTIQRKDEIEKWLVQYPLSIIAHFQALFENTLMLSGMKRSGDENYTSEFFEDVEIDCHFDAISESRSECTPDIIKQVRDAKNAKKMEMIE